MKYSAIALAMLMDLIRETFEDDLLRRVLKEAEKNNLKEFEVVSTTEGSFEERKIELDAYERALFGMYLECDDLYLEIRRKSNSKEYKNFSSEEKLSLSLEINKYGKRKEIIKFLIKERLEVKLRDCFFYEGVEFEISDGFLYFSMPSGDLERDFSVDDRGGGVFQLKIPDIYLIAGMIPFKRRN
jgi:hypothetical protein